MPISKLITISKDFRFDAYNGRLKTNTAGYRRTEKERDEWIKQKERLGWTLVDLPFDEGRVVWTQTVNMSRRREFFVFPDDIAPSIAIIENNSFPGTMSYRAEKIANWRHRYHDYVTVQRDLEHTAANRGVVYRHLYALAQEAIKYIDAQKAQENAEEIDRWTPAEFNRYTNPILDNVTLPRVVKEDFIGTFATDLRRIKQSYENNELTANSIRDYKLAVNTLVNQELTKYTSENQWTAGKLNILRLSVRDAVPGSTGYVLAGKRAFTTFFQTDVTNYTTKWKAQHSEASIITRWTNKLNQLIAAEKAKEDAKRQEQQRQEALERQRQEREQQRLAQEAQERAEQQRRERERQAILKDLERKVNTPIAPPPPVVEQPPPPVVEQPPPPVVEQPPPPVVEQPPPVVEQPPPVVEQPPPVIKKSPSGRANPNVFRANNAVTITVGEIVQAIGEALDKQRAVPVLTRQSDIYNQALAAIQADAELVKQLRAGSIRIDFT